MKTCIYILAVIGLLPLALIVTPFVFLFAYDKACWGIAEGVATHLKGKK